MKVRNSLRSLKSRHRDCQVVRRKGRIYIINKTNPPFKARQSSAAAHRTRPPAAEGPAAGVSSFGHGPDRRPGVPVAARPDRGPTAPGPPWIFGHERRP